ncbi:unnamed protein product [Rotaria sordida]|uniref:TRPM-like domain-containing protein n=1 Tax=Rotaria sordida TaxID=392033 RepID=A0A814CSU9_9BILA|nr:unnamed protein product [Rotaria sordida]
MTSANNQTSCYQTDPVIALRAEIEHQIKETFKIPIIQILANDDASSVMTNEQLDEELTCAVSMNKVRFVDILVEQGASFNRLRTRMKLEKLYHDIDFKVSLPLPENHSKNDVPNESVFANRRKMATYLCSRSTNSIASALFASKIYHQAAAITPQQEKRLHYRQKKQEFAQHASNIMDMCFAEDEQFALDILNMKSASHQNYSLLDLAKMIDSRVFLTTKTVQRYLDYKCLRKSSNATTSLAIKK